MCQPTLEADTLALAEELNQAMCVKEFIKGICRLPVNNIPIHALMDNKGAGQAFHSAVAVGASIHLGWGLWEGEFGELSHQEDSQ